MTDVSGIQQSIQKIGEQALQDKAKSSGLDQGAANAEDVQKLQAAMNQPPAEAQQVNAGQEIQGVEEVNKVSAPAQATDTPGARLLDHLNHLSTKRQSMTQDVEQVLADPNKMSMGQMMKFQYDMQNLNLMTDMTTKFGSEIGQKIDQLATKGGG